MADGRAARAWSLCETLAFILVASSACWGATISAGLLVWTIASGHFGI